MTGSSERLQRLRLIITRQEPVAMNTAESSGTAGRETREQLLKRLLDPKLNLDEAAQVLNVRPTTVRRYTNRGILQHHRTKGNQRRFRLSHVLDFLASQDAVALMDRRSEIGLSESEPADYERVDVQR